MARPSEPKFKARCIECGAQQPRPTTAWTSSNWMHLHVRENHNKEAA